MINQYLILVKEGTHLQTSSHFFERQSYMQYRHSLDGSARISLNRREMALYLALLSLNLAVAVFAYLMLVEYS